MSEKELTKISLPSENHKGFWEKVISNTNKIMDAISKRNPETSLESQEKSTTELMNQIAKNLEKGNKVAFLEDLGENEYNLTVFDLESKIKKK